MKLTKLLHTKLNLSNSEINRDISIGNVLVNHLKAELKQIVCDFDTIVYKSEILQKGKDKIYLAVYKPKGIESTLNESITGNLSTIFSLSDKLFPLGRLDKESEGLMILTNDGEHYNKITHSKSLKEKEYLVKVNKEISDEFLFSLESGIEIMGQITRPCKVYKTGLSEFKIILTQGLNRQIRRMCYKCGYEVEKLIRIRILNITIGDLKPGERRNLSDEEMVSLLNS